MSKVYNKLVRDKIPEIIGVEKCHTHHAEGEFYLTALLEKLEEEVNKIIGHDSLSNLIEELVDLDEVVRAIAEHEGVPNSEFDLIKLKKATERGTFKTKTILESVDD